MSEERSQLDLAGSAYESDSFVILEDFVRTVHGAIITPALRKATAVTNSESPGGSFRDLHNFSELPDR